MPEVRPTEQLAGHPVVRAGVFAWCVIGLLLLAAAVLWSATYLWVIVVPLVLAMFPAALIEPVTRWMKEHGVPPAVAALASVLGLLGLLVEVLVLIGFAVADQAAEPGDAVTDGYDQLRSFASESPSSTPS